MSGWWYRIILVWGFPQGPSHAALSYTNPTATNVITQTVLVSTLLWTFSTDKDFVISFLLQIDRAFYGIHKEVRTTSVQSFKLTPAKEAKFRPGLNTYPGRTNTSGHLYGVNTSDNRWHPTTKTTFRGCLGHECPCSVSCVHPNASWNTRVPTRLTSS